jgi:hypothetical protein
VKRHIPVCVLAVLALVLAGQGLSTATRSDAATVVKMSAAIDATGKNDVSVPMAAFFKSVADGSTVELPAGARYRMEQTLVLQNRHRLTIEGNGAMFFLVTPGGLKRSNVIVENSSDIVIRDLVVKGSNPHGGDVAGAYQAAREGQHGISILTDTNVWLINDTITDTYGDFVYIARVTPHDPWTNGVLILGSHFARNGRQAVTITDARNVVIAANSITDISRATFDFEPGSPSGGVDNVVIAGNDVGAGGLLFVAAEAVDPVNHVTIENNRVRGQNLQVWVANTKPGLRVGWTIVGNTSDSVSGNPHAALMRMANVNGLQIRDNSQAFSVGRNMVLAEIVASCGIDVRNNHIPGSVGPDRVSGHC